MSKKIKITFIVFILFSVCVFSQTKSDLLTKKNKLVTEIKLINIAIQSTKSGHQESVQELQLINKQMQVQTDLLKISEQYIDLLSLEKDSIDIELKNITNRLFTEKNIYAQLIINANRLELTYNPIEFIFESRSFNELLRSMYHFRQIELTRRSKYEEIHQIQAIIEKTKKSILDRKARQANLIKDQKQNIIQLNLVKSRQTHIIKSLILKQDSLTLALKNKETQAKKINDEILRLIDIESKKQQTFELTPEGRITSKHFSENRGQLYWPVSNGIITSKFGKVQHPIISSISTMNNGIEITTNSRDVNSVFKGVITKILILPNGLKVVIVRHGEYLSVYSNLYDVSVAKNQHIEAKDIIGTLYIDKASNTNVLGFQIWKGREKLNPSHWLIK